jgi:hypothetical protein
MPNDLFASITAEQRSVKQDRDSDGCRAAGADRVRLSVVARLSKGVERRYKAL